MMLTFIDVVTVNFNWFVAVIFWICVSPPAFLFNLQPTNKTSNLYIEPEVHSPFDHTNLISIIEEFFLPVCDGKRILFSVKNPEGEYFKIFDGYRYLLEPLMWVVSKRSILLMPNWYSVMENNFLAAPTFWGRDLGSIYKNLNNFDCDYVLYYYDELNPIQAGILEEFKPLSEYGLDSLRDKVIIGDVSYDQMEAYFRKGYYLALVEQLRHKLGFTAFDRSSATANVKRLDSAQQLLQQLLQFRVKLQR
jgi:hypothetical protein